MNVIVQLLDRQRRVVQAITLTLAKGQEAPDIFVVNGTRFVACGVGNGIWRFRLASEMTLQPAAPQTH